MKCIVCDEKTEWYFSKQFPEEENPRNYYECTGCGWVGADVSEQDKMKWYTSPTMFTPAELANRDGNWVGRLSDQARFLFDMSRMLPKPWLDWGAGQGVLEHHLSAYRMDIESYDKYCGGELKRDKYGFVVTTSVFEHIDDRETLNGIDALVDNVMGLHTVVVEKVPQDPDWFYLHLTHISFFTNRSMEILFEKWGYKYSVYHKDSRMWLWFKKVPFSLGTLTGKHGFVDYWK